MTEKEKNYNLWCKECKYREEEKYYEGSMCYKCWASGFGKEFNYKSVED